MVAAATRTLDQYVPNPRRDKAEVIASVGTNVKRVDSNLFTVKSQTGIGIYRVDNSDGWACNCPDHITRLLDCKHILAVRIHLARTEISLEERVALEPKVPVRPYPERDWHQYTKSQTEEWKLFGELLHDLLKGVEEPDQVRGRPRLPLAEQLFCAITKVYSQQSSRRASGLYDSAVEDEYISHAPNYNAINKFFNSGDTNEILRELIRQSALPLSGLEVDFGADSSGFRTNTFSAWHGNKHGEKKKHRWLKAHIMSGRLTNIISDAIVTDGHAGDSPHFIPLVEGTAAGGFTMNEVSADKAYSSRNNLQAVGDMGATPYIPFKKNARARAARCAMWHRMFHYFQMNKEEFYEHYHKRSNVETTFACIKRKFGECLKSKNRVAQENELLAKILAYNITALIRAMFEFGISPSFFNGGIV